jgi:single-strand DNA-binding protein
LLNRVILIGRLTRDPELRYLQNGTAVATFTLAINRKYNKEETDFIDIVAWRQLAEHCANYLSKGRMVAVEGRLQIRSYEDKEGQKRKAAEIVADDVRFLDRGTSSSKTTASANPPNDDWEALGREVSRDEIDIVENHRDDEIPF